MKNAIEKSRPNVEIAEPVVDTQDSGLEAPTRNLLVLLEAQHVCLEAILHEDDLLLRVHSAFFKSRHLCEQVMMNTYLPTYAIHCTVDILLNNVMNTLGQFSEALHLQLTFILGASAPTQTSAHVREGGIRSPHPPSNVGLKASISQRNTPHRC